MAVEFLKVNEIRKKWGKEVVIVNNDSYCGKILCINKGKKFSMHFHMLKDETWYVAKGALLFRWIDTSDARIMERILLEGMVVRLSPGDPHQLVAQEDSEIYEVSTTHFDQDSYRVGPGDSQT
jgi:mannose-6-phosphate isomerase-like protein (cupin superfamily)